VLRMRADLERMRDLLDTREESLSAREQDIAVRERRYSQEAFVFQSQAAVQAKEVPKLIDKVARKEAETAELWTQLVEERNTAVNQSKDLHRQYEEMRMKETAELTDQLMICKGEVAVKNAELQTVREQAAKDVKMLQQELRAVRGEMAKMWVTSESRAEEFGRREAQAQEGARASSVLKSQSMHFGTREKHWEEMMNRVQPDVRVTRDDAKARRQASKVETEELAAKIAGFQAQISKMEESERAEKAKANEELEVQRRECLRLEEEAAALRHELVPLKAAAGDVQVLQDELNRHREIADALALSVRMRRQVERVEPLSSPDRPPKAAPPLSERKAVSTAVANDSAPKAVPFSERKAASIAVPNDSAPKASSPIGARWVESLAFGRPAPQAHSPTRAGGADSIGLSNRVVPQARSPTRGGGADSIGLLTRAQVSVLADGQRAKALSPTRASGADSIGLSDRLAPQLSVPSDALSPTRAGGADSIGSSNRFVPQLSVSTEAPSPSRVGGADSVGLSNRIAPQGLSRSMQETDRLLRRLREQNPPPH